MKRMQIDDNSEQLDLLMSSLNAIKKELRAIKTDMTFESKLAYTNQDLRAMFDVGTKTIKKWGRGVIFAKQLIFNKVMV